MQASTHDVMAWVHRNVTQSAMGAVAARFTPNRAGGSRVSGAALDEAQYVRFLYLLKASRQAGSPRSLSPREVAAVMGRDESWGRKMATRIIVDGICGAYRNGGGANDATTKLTPAARGVLLDIVRRYPQYTLEWIKSELFFAAFIIVDKTTVSRCLKKMGLCRVVRGVIAHQRADVNIMQYDIQFRLRVSTLDIDRCGWFDSAQVNRKDGNVRSRKAWGVKGGRVRIPKVFVRDPTSTMMSAVLTTAGMVCMDMTPEHVDADYMDAYFARIAPTLAAVGIRYFILDNARVHNVAMVSTIFNFYGISAIFLPPYVAACAVARRAASTRSPAPPPSPSPPFPRNVRHGQIHSGAQSNRNGVAMGEGQTSVSHRRALCRSRPTADQPPREHPCGVLRELGATCKLLHRVNA